MARKLAVWMLIAPGTVILLGYMIFVAVPNFLDNIRNQRVDSSHQECRWGNEDDPRYFRGRPSSGAVKVIHLTNSGELAKRCELTDVLYELNWDRPIDRSYLDYGPCYRVDAKSLPKLVVLFIHGWKHGDDGEDTNLIDFERKIKNLAIAREDRQVLGVYITWNARWGLYQDFENLSFWAKKLLADRIAQSGSVTSIISAIGSIKNRVTSGDQFIAIGHSFGARLLFSATSSILLYESQMAHPGSPAGTYSKIRSPVDLIFLVNPAFEATLYTSLDSMRRAKEKFFADQTPLLISISSTADGATQKYFPLGQRFERVPSLRGRTTLGNYKDFMTHRLISAGESKKLCSESAGLTKGFLSNGLCLWPEDNGARPTPDHFPFVVAQTSLDIIKDHNAIWGDDFFGWMFAISAAVGKSVPSENIASASRARVNFRLGDRLDCYARQML